MTLSVGQSIAIIAVCAACTFLERWLPWLLFGRRAVPKVVERVSIDAPPAAPPKASKANTPVEAKVEAKPKARTQKASAKGQRSLFDF